MWVLPRPGLKPVSPALAGRFLTTAPPGKPYPLPLQCQICPSLCSFFIFIYLFIYGCVGSSFLCEGFLPLRQAGATLHRGARASHYRGLSCCGAQAPDAQAQQLWPTGPVAPRHVGSSRTRARTRVPCTGRQTLNRCATREAPEFVFLNGSAYFCLDVKQWATGCLSAYVRVWGGELLTRGDYPRMTILITQKSNQN